MAIPPYLQTNATELSILYTLLGDFLQADADAPHLIISTKPGEDFTAELVPGSQAYAPNISNKQKEETLTLLFDAAAIHLNGILHTLHLLHCEEQGVFFTSQLPGTTCDGGNFRTQRKRVSPQKSAMCSGVTLLNTKHPVYQEVGSRTLTLEDDTTAYNLNVMVGDKQPIYVQTWGSVEDPFYQLCAEIFGGNIAQVAHIVADTPSDEELEKRLDQLRDIYGVGKARGGFERICQELRKQIQNSRKGIPLPSNSLFLPTTQRLRELITLMRAII